jgi:hypothetical protein
MIAQFNACAQKSSAAAVIELVPNIAPLFEVIVISVVPSTAVTPLSLALSSADSSI